MRRLHRCPHHRPRGYRPTDPELYDKLKQLVADGDRSVQAVRKRNLLPPDTHFYEEPLTLSHLPKGTTEAIAARHAHRQKWLAGALKATEGCALVFFDPDNGLEVQSVRTHHDKGPKFTFYDELKPFWDRGQSLVIYQHKNMHESAEAQITSRTQELQDRLGFKGNVEAHYFPKFGGRIFFLVSP